MEVVGRTANNREIRTDGSSFFVQPKNDNYWVEVSTYEDACLAYWTGTGELSVQAAADYITDGWDTGCFLATAEYGIASVDASEIRKVTKEVEAVTAEIMRRCVEVARA